MKILVTCPRSSKGFSLPEVLVVVAIVGLATAIVLPNFSKIIDRLESWAQKGRVVALVNRLGHEAHNRRSLIDQNSFIENEGFKQYFPPGWALSGDLIYLANGACSGGKIFLSYKDVIVMQDELEAPFCQMK